MDWNIILIISTILLGLIFVILEVLVLPGGVIGILGVGLLGYGVYMSFEGYGVTGGTISLGATSVVVIAGIYYAIRNKTWNKISLQEEIVGKSGVNLEMDISEGATGKSISRLCPTGTARIDNNVYEVSTTGEFIDENQEIIVSRIKDQRIYVKLNN